jgi:ribosomal protein L22
MSTPASPEEGKPDSEKVEQEAAESKQAAAEASADVNAETEAAEAAEEPSAEEGAPLAEGTAAAETGVDKQAAAAALAGAEAPEAESDRPSGSARRKARGRRAASDEPVEAAPTRSKRPAGEPAPTVRAHAKYVRTSARKARLVCDHIRGKSVNEARAILAHTPRAVAQDWSKLLESAVANAEHNHELLGDDLRIVAITADEGPTLKRFRPRAMGRATPIRKRTAHLSIALEPKE